MPRQETADSIDAIMWRLSTGKKLGENDYCELQQKLRQADARANDLATEKQRLDMLLQQTKRNSTFAFILTMIASVALALGANIVTSESPHWMGWAMIGFSGIIGFVAFCSQRGSKAI
jgi:hypothetical protein